MITSPGPRFSGPYVLHRVRHLLDHRAEVDGLREPLRDGAQLGVEERAREVRPRLDVRRVGAASQGQDHLVRRRDERVADHLERDRIEGRRFTGALMPPSPPPGRRAVRPLARVPLARRRRPRPGRARSRGPGARGTAIRPVDHGQRRRHERIREQLVRHLVAERQVRDGGHRLEGGEGRDRALQAGVTVDRDPVRLGERGELAQPPEAARLVAADDDRVGRLRPRARRAARRA